MQVYRQLPQAVNTVRKTMRSHYGTITLVAVVIVIFLAVSCIGKETVVPSATLSLPMTKPPDSTNTPIPTVVEPGLAYGIPCKPPCWQELTPGESTGQEAEEAMVRLRASGWADSITGDSLWGYQIYPSPFTIHGSIYVNVNNDDTVVEIGGTTLFYYPVRTLIEQFGGPEGLYIVSKGSTGCSSCEGWEPPEPPDMPVMSVPAHLLYPRQGLRFSILIPLSGLGCICPEMKVVGFRYYAPTSMREALAEFDQVTEEDLVEWHGFEGGY